MGDRTYCEIRINKHYYNLLAIAHRKDLEDMYDELEDDGDEVVMKESEANYGNMDELENLLKENKIEYNKRWEDGDEFKAGEEFARIVNGKYCIHDISDQGQGILQEYKELEELIMKGADLELVKKHIENRIILLEPFKITPLRVPQSIDFIKNK